MIRHLDPGSLIVMTVTLILFVAALFVKGFTHDLFLEAGIFLVSLKIIMMSYRNHLTMERVEAKLDAILELEALEAYSAARTSPQLHEKTAPEYRDGSIDLPVKES